MVRCSVCRILKIDPLMCFAATCKLTQIQLRMDVLSLNENEKRDSNLQQKRKYQRVVAANNKIIRKEKGSFSKGPLTLKAG